MLCIQFICGIRGRRKRWCNTLWRVESEQWLNEVGCHSDVMCNLFVKKITPRCIILFLRQQQCFLPLQHTLQLVFGRVFKAVVGLCTVRMMYTVFCLYKKNMYRWSTWTALWNFAILKRKISHLVGKCIYLFVITEIIRQWPASLA